MAHRKGRAVSVAEKPIYQHCTRLFNQGTLHAFWAFDRNEWAYQHAAGDTVNPRTLDGMKDLLRRIDPDGCTWDKATAGKTGKTALLDLSRRLLAALTTGDHDERLIIEATALISAA